MNQVHLYSKSVPLNISSTSTLIATGLGCPGDTETAVIGFLIAYQLTHKAEIDHCIIHKIMNNLNFSLWYDLKNSESWRRNKKPPYLTSGTVTELSAMFVERIICKYKQQNVCYAISITFLQTLYKYKEVTSG